jgi:hypothetical protein
MSRSLWREALDGKAKMLRDLRDPSNWQFIENMAVAADNAAGLTRMSDPFFWTVEMANEAARASDQVSMEQSLYRIMLPAENGIHWFHRPAHVVLVESDEQGQDVRQLLQVRVRALVWDSYGRDDEISDLFDTNSVEHVAGTTIIAFIETPTGLSPYAIPNLLEGSSLESSFDRGEEGTREHQQLPAGYTVDQAVQARFAIHSFAGRFMIASSKLLRERLMVEAPELDRTTRRQYSYQGQDPTVQVVNWRKLEYQYSEDHESQPVDWSCHWQVRKHTRTYKATGRTIVIDPYIKGNLRAPYKPPAEVTVNVVRR